jgi:hypothetical protein
MSIGDDVKVHNTVGACDGVTSGGVPLIGTEAVMICAELNRRGAVPVCGRPLSIEPREVQASVSGLC